MLVISAAWLALFWVFSGIGLLIWRRFGPPALSLDTLMLCFWTGWSCSILLLQLWHLWFPIDGRAQAIVVLLGLLGLFLNRRPVWELVKDGVLRKKTYALILVIAGLWLAGRANGPVMDYNTGLYHLASVQWANTYPIVPGLGNLHDRLALNSSFFLYAALLNTGWLAGRGHLIANGLLIAVLALHTLSCLLKLIFEPTKINIYRVFHALLLAAALVLIFGEFSSKSQLISIPFLSLSPDVPVFTLQVVVCGALLALLSERDCAESEQRYLVVSIALLALVGITIKLSFVVFGIAAIGIALALWLRNERYRSIREHMPTMLLVALCAAVALLPWMIRGVILSGYPIYPSTIGAVDVEWRVPRALVISEANWIRSWARKPFTHWVDVLSNTDWLRPWLLEFVRLKPIQLTLCGLLLVMLAWLIPGRKRRSANWFCLLPAALAIVFWFVSAPDPRFAGASFWILAAGLTSIAMERTLDWGDPKFGGVRWVALALCIVFVGYIPPFRGPLWNSALQLGLTDLQPLHQIEYRSLATKSGLGVNRPVVDDRCWAAPLPCTPNFRPGLRLRKAGDLGAGFLLDRRTAFVDIHQAGTPAGVIASANIGVALPSGWYDFEKAAHLRWMRGLGSILVYTEHPTNVRLSLTPRIMNIGRKLGNTGQLIITVNSDNHIVVPVSSGVTSSVMLGLQGDFNIIKLELAAGAFVPQEQDSKLKDSRALGIAFGRIELAEMKPPSTHEK